MKNIQRPLIVAGYSLFVLLVITTLIGTTIPFTALLFNPKVIHYNVAITVVALTIGALLPTLLGYFIGDRAVKTKSKSSRHFTGVLFGLLSYWIMILLSVLITIPMGAAMESGNVDLIVASVIPSLGVAIAAAFLAVAHLKSRHAKKEILQYKPFSFALIIVTVGLPLFSLMQSIVFGTINLYSFEPILLLLAVGVISYVSLRGVKLSMGEKMTWVAVSVSVLFAATFVLPQIINTVGYMFNVRSIELLNVINYLGLASAVLVWAMYWLKQLKTLR